jgi:hypothetical protein
METPREEPLYWDSNRRPTAVLFIMASVTAVLGLFQWQNSGDPTLLILGGGVAAYSWFTNAKSYLIFSERLVINFGTPRKRIIPFNQISHVEFLSLPTMGDRVRIRMLSGRGIMLQTKDTEAFHDRLDEALSDFHGPQPEYPLDRSDSVDEDQP